MATADPGTLPDKATWYLVTNLPRPGGPREAGQPAPGRRPWPRSCASTAIRNWIEQGYKQVKDELGWADFQVRSDLAIRRHQALVNCAFSFCWDAWFADQPAHRSPRLRSQDPAAERGGPAAAHRRRHPGRGRCARSAPGSSPWIALQRWWTAWSKAPPPPPLQALISSVAAGCGLHLYIPN